MNQLFYNIAGGIVQQIRREKRTTISEVILRCKRNRNWFYFKFSVESSSFVVNNFKTEKVKLTFEGWNRPVCHLLVFTSVFLSKFDAFHRRPVKRVVTALMSSLLFRCFSLFLPHLRTLAQEKRSENCLRFGTGGPSLCLHSLLSRNIFFPALTMAARAKNISGKAICSRHQPISVLCRDLEHAYVYWIWLRGSASYVITDFIPTYEFTGFKRESKAAFCTATLLFNKYIFKYYVFMSGFMKTVLKTAGTKNSRHVFRKSVRFVFAENTP